MNTDNSSLGSAIGPIIQRIFTSGKITQADEYGFFSAIASDAVLSAEELSQIRRISDHLDMGLLKVVD
ncbi:hypothetical protein H6F90_26165 [Trichocoleus sp. FACHB-591]|uniref:hypothetical protein n=1 Tax=Trichocoleus sp. FACHB-591 TaxID=2692872 RepID=UPI00168264B1|nr:hypothetical protein [Trichocoleus sp. FACHB-591]MBD2098560.1 hypothetical protein [Trichocoleus sp. FACHB-591]